ncbi:MAG: peptide ABC transporter substrate-binding protein [Oscillibacter sp.]|nr:peptide ABC transporter substrate-binding protein [Oscillibacter sp.]
MNVWKRMAAVLLMLALLAGLATGCGEQEETLTVSAAIGDGIETFDPIYAVDEEDQSLLTHLYENLLRKKTDGTGAVTLIGGMAKSWESEENHDGTVTWTFKLRSARWSDGRVVKAKDFVYAWRRLANPSSGSPFASMLSIVAGYDEVCESGDTSLLQVTAKNDTTLEVVLNGNYDWFLKDVCTAVATSPLREDIVTAARDAAVERNKALEQEDGVAGTEKWWTRTEDLVTNGPYVVNTYEWRDSISLTRFERYYENEAGPLELTFRFVSSPEEAQSLYDAGEADLIWPMTDEWMETMSADESWIPTTELGTYTVLMNNEHPILADALVRQAMTTALDRTTLAQTVGVTARAAEALVPPGVPDDSEDEDFRTCAGPLLDNEEKSYVDRCAQSQQLLAEAGYDSGYHLGELEYLYVDTVENAVVAEELARQWLNVLNVHIIPTAVTEKELRTALREGDYVLAGMELEAVANDAECFLMHWTSDSENNVIHYANSAYDTLLAIIANAPDGTARLGCLHDAELLLLEDNALCPLYTRVTAWTLRETLAGLGRDERGWFCLADIYKRTA